LTLFLSPGAPVLRKAAIVAGASVLSLGLSAHVGSPDTWFEGTAGPWPVRIVVRSPPVIPGLADVIVTVTDPGVTAVTATPAAYNATDPSRIPPADTARAVAGRPGTWTVPLWIMVPGSYSVRVTVAGARGSGTAIVPVSAAATRVLGMDRRLGWLLAGLGVFLLAGAVTIVGAAVRESVLAPGEVPDRRRKLRARLAMGGGGFVFVLLLTGGKVWWNAVDRGYRRGLDRRWAASALAVSVPGGTLLRFTIADSVWRGRSWNNRASTPLIPDHGKLMHLFLVRESDAGAFAHLHPVSRDTATFEAPLPPLPPGRYRVFADVTHESGFARTLVASVVLPERGASPSASPAGSGSSASANGVPADPDDAWFTGAPVDSVAPLAGGARLVWEGKPERIAVDQDAGLRFVVREADGSVGRVEPYLGMAGHAVVMREDGGVYIHLHPMGTISAAAEIALRARLPSDTAWGTLGRRLTESGALGHVAGHAMTFDGRIGFPYAFPDPGSYRIWVQVRRGGVVETAEFRAVVGRKDGKTEG
jgi:hypothetical protein